MSECAGNGFQSAEAHTSRLLQQPAGLSLAAVCLTPTAPAEWRATSRAARLAPAISHPYININTQSNFSLKVKYPHSTMHSIHDTQYTLLHVDRCSSSTKMVLWNQPQVFLRHCSVGPFLLPFGHLSLRKFPQRHNQQLNMYTGPTGHPHAFIQSICKPGCGLCNQQLQT